MRKIGVHLENVRVATRERIRKSGTISGTEPLFAAAVQHGHTRRVVCCQPIRQRTGSIRGIVVDHEYVEVALRQNQLDQSLQILCFVICRDDNKIILHHFTTWSISRFTSPPPTDHTCLEWSSAWRIHVSPPSALFSCIASRILFDITM